MCNIKILKIHLCGANFNTLRFLTQRYCFFGLDTFPLVHVLAIVSATSMQSPMNGNLTYLHSLHFHFCPLFCGVGTKLWNILALSHAKTLGPTNFFSTVTHSTRSLVKTYTTYLWMEWFLWPCHFKICQIIRERPTLPYYFYFLGILCIFFRNTIVKKYIL